MCRKEIEMPMMSVSRHHSSSRPCPPRRWLAVAIILTIPCLAAGASGYEGEFIPFPEVTIHYNNKDVPNLKQHGSAPLVDFFYSAKHDRWRLLGEFLVSDDERDLERLLVGRVTASGSQLWLGRNHSDLDQWNRLFHRVTYLQTTIHRPGIIEFEDEGGILPAHITGLSMENSWSRGETDLDYRITLGLSPILKQQQLVPYDILKVNSDSHRLALTALVSDQSMGGSFKDSGLFLGHAIISSQGNSLSKIKQTVLGAYTNLGLESNLLLRTSVFYVVDDVDLLNGSYKNSSFAYAYLQPEYNFDSTWTLYGRVELNSGAKDDLYVQQIPAFVRQRALIGARYQMRSSQVLKFEIAELQQFGQRFQAVEMQWSAAIQ